MTNTQKLILTQEQISLKIKRMAYQIWEEHADHKEIVMIGIAENGYILAELLTQCIESISKIKIQKIQLNINKKDPLLAPSSISQNLNKKAVILVDDVSNSGKVMLYALQPICAYLPLKISLAVLVDRKHKAYPINPNYVGHSLSTTLLDNITVVNNGKTFTAAYLD